MKNYPITISKDKEIHHFEVGEYLHYNNESCKYKVFENDILVASFEPDAHNYLHICQNPAGMDEEILHLLADQIEAHHPQPANHHLKPIEL